VSEVRQSDDAAGLMDRMYRFQRHIYDATRKFYLLGRDGLVDGLQPPTGGAVLEVGCGTGRNLIKIARAYPQARCYGLDVSEEMLATARRAVAKAGLSGRITLKQADATSFEPEALFGRLDFDRVVISYALSMIPPWRAVLARALATLAPGGSLHIVDFGDQAHLPGAFRAVLNRWLALFQVTPRLELGAELERLCTEAGASSGTRRLYGGYAVQGLATRRG
jgi:S-adenosylmethionine-diacylgycerolhomoserine-N-methlytransferase